MACKFVYKFIRKGLLTTIHMIFGVGIVWSILVALVYFLISKFVLTKKLNLE